AVVVGRILGVRHLVQATLSGVRPTSEVLAMGAWVDAVHALTALGLAGTDRARARAALTDAAFASAWAAAGYRDLTSTHFARTARQRRRDRLARAVLRHVPGGPALLTRTDDDRKDC
ncbi:hypothetical protein, partial [Jatrophihabitans endophyticus]|uniref:hypothetical protein n=1 Tax=Jatrophihabitans endophyticus TaxID=1206085 RepID=UPI0019D941F2